MNGKVLVSSALAAALVAGAVVLMLWRAGEARPEASPVGAEVARLTEDVDALRGELAAAREALRRIEARVAAGAAPDAAGPGAAAGPGEAGLAATSGRDGEQDVVPTASPEGAPEDPVLAHLVAGDGAAELKRFIAGVIEEDRVERRRKQQEDAAARAAELAAMQEGPFGKHNYKVNSLGKKLDLSDRQKQGYFDLLTLYGEHFGALRKGAYLRDPEQRKLYHEQRAGLQEEFDVSFTQLLDADQAQAYKDLPAWEKQADANAQVFVSTTTTDGGDVLGLTENVFGVDMGAVHVELPAPPIGAGAAPDGGGVRIERKIKIGGE